MNKKIRSVVLTAVFGCSCLISSVSFAKIVVSNHLSVGGYLYLKVGINGGGLSSGFTDSRTWDNGQDAHVYCCTTAFSGALCDRLAFCDLPQGVAYGKIKITGRCDGTNSVNVHVSPGIYCYYVNDTDSTGSVIVDQPNAQIEALKTVNKSIQLQITQLQQAQPSNNVDIQRQISALQQTIQDNEKKINYILNLPSLPPGS